MNTFFLLVVLFLLSAFGNVAGMILCALLKSRKKTLTPKCDHCGSTEGVKLEDSRTQRYWNGQQGIDPNAPIPYCRECAEQHHAYWDAMWDEYHKSLG